MMLSLMAAALMFAGPTETHVTLEATPAPLHGTMLRPAGEMVAAAVIIPGSGPTDRDGNSPLGVSNGSLKQLAEGLAARGIATVRIDKRGIAASIPAVVSEAQLRFDTYVEDARNWARLTAEQTGASCVWLIGHSEGALVVQSAAADKDAPVCGQILLAGVGRPVGVVLREQLSVQLPQPLKDETFDMLAELEAGRTVENPPVALMALLRPSVQPYLISWMKRDPAQLARDYDGPIFIGQGTTDLHTTVVDAQALHSAQPRSELNIWEGINHTLTEAPADRAANIATYTNVNAKIAPQVIEDVADFILTPR